MRAKGRRKWQAWIFVVEISIASARETYSKSGKRIAYIDRIGYRVLYCIVYKNITTLSK